MSRVNIPKFGEEQDTRGMQTGQDREAQIALEGPAEIDKDDIEVVPGPKLGDKADIEKFMAEMVTIIIHPSAERYPEDPVPVGVNGRQIFVWRNKPTIMRRCYVERLARAKHGNVDQDAANPDPAVANRLQLSASLRYPFSVLKDPSGDKGHAWLQKVMAEV